MFELTIERNFNASHAIRLYDDTIEPMHSHDWQVVVHVTSNHLDQIEVVMDFHELQRMVDNALTPFHGAVINELPAFAIVNPSAERIVEYIYRTIASKLPEHVNLSRVTLTEAPGCRASYYE